MRNAFNVIMVSGLATLFLAPSGLAGDIEKCKKGADCSKVSGKQCDSKAEPKDSKENQHGNKDDRKPKAEHRMNKLTTFSFHQTGGFIGVNRGYEVTLADLSEKDRSNLEQLIEKSGLLEGTGGDHITGGACDMFVYSFSASEGDKKHSVTFDDGTIPQSYRPLLAFTKEKVVDLKRK